jgi:hypothetical protein
MIDFGGVAQLGERVVRNDEVRGSIPLTSTNKKPTILLVGFLSPSSGGEGGIRTREDLAALLPFQGSQFNHSCTSPKIQALSGM